MSRASCDRVQCDATAWIGAPGMEILVWVFLVIGPLEAELSDALVDRSPSGELGPRESSDVYADWQTRRYTHTCNGGRKGVEGC